MSLTSFPSPPDLKLDFKDMVLDGKNHVFSKYGPSNPHPGFGTDPNILNVYGHTKYPMKVGKITVKNAEEEAAERAKLEGKTSVPQVEQKPAEQTNAWPSQQNANPWPTDK